jgi:hypothetical protein
VMAVAKGKKRLSEIAKDEEAVKEYEKQILVPKKKAGDVRYRDEVPSKDIINIMADEIEAIVDETGGKIDRLNAREFYAMNIWRGLLVKGVHARDKKVPMTLCKDHK